VRPRERIRAYGAAAATMALGVACSAAIPGASGEIAGIVLVSLGGVGAMSLVFYEVGRSEERERRDEARAASAAVKEEQTQQRQAREAHRTSRGGELPRTRRLPGARGGDRRRRPPRRPR
jgi:hypothetical protein